MESNGVPRPQPVQEIRMTIILQTTPNGRSVAVNGPITDKGLCYMMLELARDAVKDFDPAKQAATILIPQKI